MTSTFDSEVSLHYWLLWPTVQRADIGSFRRPIGCAKNEIVAILETDWLYCAWQSRQEKILRMSVSRLGELFVVAREGKHAHFLRIHISNKPKVANWF